MKKNLFLVILSLTFVNYNLIAQTETDEKAFIDFTDGVGFVTPDSLFGMNIRYRMQNRASYLFDDKNGESELEATVKRCRLRFDGFIKDSKLTYYLQLSFSRGDLAIDEEYVHNIVRDAMIYYRFSDKFYVGFGQGKLPGNRQRVISSGMLQFADRSIVNSRFNIDRDFGIMGYYSNNKGFMHYNIKTAISTGDGRNVVYSDENLAYTGRIELLPLGPFTNKGDFFEGDLERESRPKISIAATYSLNKSANKTDGQRGEISWKQRDISSIFADVLFKYNGWSFFCEYARKIVESPIIINFPPAPNLVFYTGSGVNVQLSYIFKNDLEIAGRYSQIKPGEFMPKFHRYDYHYALGATKYINKHKTKLQFNLNYYDYQYPDKDMGYGKFGAVFQVEIGI